MKDNIQEEKYGVPDNFKLFVSEEEQQKRKYARRESDANDRRELEKANERKKIKNKPCETKKRYKDFNKRIFSFILAMTLGAVGHVGISNLAKDINASRDVKQAIATVQEYEKQKESVLESPFYTNEYDFQQGKMVELPTEEKEQLMSEIIESINNYAKLRNEKRNVEDDKLYTTACNTIANFDAKALYNGIIKSKLSEIFGEDAQIHYSYETDRGETIIRIKVEKDGHEENFLNREISKELRNAIISTETYSDESGKEYESNLDKKLKFLQEAFELSGKKFQLNDKGNKIIEIEKTNDREDDGR